MKSLLKRIYGLIPFKKQFYLFIKIFGTPNRNIYKHLHFVDNVDINVGEGRQFKIRHYGFQVENDIFWAGIYRGWEKVSLSIWAELCEHSNTIFDIGANTGVYALLAKAINPNAKVAAFEPVERVYDKLDYNVKLNGYDILAVKKAASNFDGEATIYDRDSPHTYSVTVNVDITETHVNAIPTTINTIRLDSFIEAEAIPKIDLLKVDVETHEKEVLEGFGKYLKEFEPTFLIEILNDEVAKGVEDIIADIDYKYFVIDEKSGIKEVSHLRKSDFLNFLICKPELVQKLETIKRFSALYKKA